MFGVNKCDVLIKNIFNVYECEKKQLSILIGPEYPGPLNRWLLVGKPSNLHLRVVVVVVIAQIFRATSTRLTNWLVNYANFHLHDYHCWSD